MTVPIILSETVKASATSDENKKLGLAIRNTPISVAMMVIT
jgi:hypothetical protein